MLDRRADTDKHHPDVADVFHRFKPDGPLFGGVLQNAGVDADLERADEMGGRPAVGTSDEAVPLQPTQVTPDGHLRDVEVASQGADLDRLVLGHTLQDLETSLDSQHVPVTHDVVRS